MRKQKIKISHKKMYTYQQYESNINTDMVICYFNKMIKIFTSIQVTATKVSAYEAAFCCAETDITQEN